MDELCGIAINRLHISSMDFYNLTPIEYHEALQDWGKQIEYGVQSNYNVSRWIVRHLWNMQGKYLKHPIKKVTDVEEFAWDKKEVQTKEEVIKAIKSIFGGMAKRTK